jgi:hypothetical protein
VVATNAARPRWQCADDVGKLSFQFSINMDFRAGIVRGPTEPRTILYAENPMSGEGK